MNEQTCFTHPVIAAALFVALSPLLVGFFAVAAIAVGAATLGLGWRRLNALPGRFIRHRTEG